MARSPLAQEDQVFADRFQPELGIKGHNAKYLRRPVSCPRGNVLDNLLRQISVNTLRFLQNRNQAAFVTAVVIKHIIKPGKVIAFFFSITTHSYILITCNMFHSPVHQGIFLNFRSISCLFGFEKAGIYDSLPIRKLICYTKNMRNYFCLIMFAILLVFQAEAQAPGGTGVQQLTALQNFRQGRDLEAMNRMNDANIHYNEAVRQCLDAVNRNAATGETYTVLTWVMQRQRRFTEVISWGERGLRLFPDEYRIIQTMGEAYFYLDDYEQSLAYMQRYTNVLPQGERASVAYFFIGEIYRLTEKYHHADIAYTTANWLESNIALWWYRLGSVREEVGDRTPAIEAYQQALRFNPNYSQARSGLARLQGNP
jgi:tetratricopeptide (TPR) repeat protein